MAVANIRPTRSAVKPLAQCTSVAEALDHPELRARLAAALPRHMSPERLLRTFHLALQKTPDLAKADMRELIGALVGFAAIGIEPNTPLGHGWLIPFAKREKRDGQWVTTGMSIQPIIGYRGYIDLARRSGTIQSIHADVVYEGDQFSYEYGTEEHLRHVYGPRDGDLVPLFAYAIARVGEGHQFEVMRWSEVLAIRDGSQGYQQAKRRGGRSLESSPWVAHTEAMARKTAVRRLAKMLPLSIELAAAAALDEMGDDRGVHFAHIVDVPASDLQEDAAATVAGVIESPREEDPAPRQTVKAKAKAKDLEPEPEPEPEAEAEPEAEPEVFDVLKFGDGARVVASGESSVDLASTFLEELKKAPDVWDFQAYVLDHSDLLESISAHDGGDLNATIGELLETLRGDEEAEEEEGAPDARRDWTVALEPPVVKDGKVVTMAAQKAIDDLSRECQSPQDWKDLVADNKDLLAEISQRSKRAHDNFMARYNKAVGDA